MVRFVFKLIRRTKLRRESEGGYVMGKQRKRGVLYFFLLVLFLYGLCIAPPAQAGVKLMGWSDLNPNTTPNGQTSNAGTYQYVLFGKYNSTPILWRILSADQTGTTRKGYLYSEKGLLNRAFDDVVLYSNNYGTSSIRNFLVGTTGSDFYISSNFTATEKSAVIVQSFATADGQGNNLTTTENAMFLPSSDDLKVSVYGFLNSVNSDVNRKAVDTLGGGVSYWTRSPVAAGANGTWHVGNAGDLSGFGVFAPAPAVRPACFLNLDSLLFKSASDDFVPGLPAGEVGSGQNPYVLVLPNLIPTGSPAGWTTQFVSADKTPVSATIDGKTVTLEWDRALSPAVTNWPVPTDFVLSTGQSPIGVISDADPKRLILTFAADVPTSGLKISYNLNTDAIAFAKSGNQVSVVNSFVNINVTQGLPSTPNVIPTQARFDGLSPENLNFLLGGAALSAANAGILSIVLETPSGTRIPMERGDYRIESRYLTIFQAFLSSLGDGTHTIYLYRDTVQVGKITLMVINSSGDTKGSDSSGCNAGIGMGALLFLFSGMAALRKKN